LWQNHLIAHHCRLGKPQQWRNLFRRNEVSNKSVRERGVGFVFQNYALFRHMTVFDNVAFGLQVLPKNQRPSKADIADRVHELLKMVQLDWLSKSYPHQLSGGQRQRVALARALAVKPKLLLLDEPFGALDAKVRKELRQWLRDIHHEFNVTSLLVTHDQEEALEISDQIVVMNHGKVEQVGSGATLYDEPDNAFVTEFLGEQYEHFFQTDFHGIGFGRGHACGGSGSG
jgi:sulfate transport system ATP-binding protein